MRNVLKTCRYLGAGLIATVCLSCTGSSRVESAVVTGIEGVPCFSVPWTKETNKGIPLFGLSVARMPGPDENLPEIVWSFEVKPVGSSILAVPGKCLPYGATPMVAGKAESKLLLPYHIYGAQIQAKQDNTNLKGFTAEFCLKPAANGKLRVQAIPWDDKNERWYYQVCAKS